MTPDTFIQSFEHLADAANGVQRLRELIFQLAVQGRLVTQDINDEPASVLLKKIKEGKQRLIQEGRMRRQDPVAAVEPSDVPYELPSNWWWVRVDSIANRVHYGYTASARESRGDVLFLRITDIQNDTVDWSTVPGCTIDEESVPDYGLSGGDILIARTGGTIGKSYLVGKVPGRAVFASYLIRIVPSPMICAEYLKIFLGSTLYWSQLYEKSMGTGQPNVNGTALRHLIFPLPPRAEQQRIAAKVNELMKSCDELEARQKQRNERRTMLTSSCLHALTSMPCKLDATALSRVSENFNLLIDTPESVTELRKTILQLAVQGRFVSQDPTDEPASILLDRIEFEKAHLIREGKIRKQEPMASPDPADVPYALPRGWTWVRLGDIGFTQTGTTPSKTRSEYFGPGYPFVKPGDITEAGVEFGKEEVSEAGMAVARFIPAGSAMMVCIGGSIGKVGYVDRDCSCNQQINTITPYSQQDGHFVAYWMKSPLIQNQVMALAPQTTLPILSKGKWESLLYPLPPLSEQKRILAKIKSLMALCDEVDAKLARARNDADILMAAFVHHLCKRNICAEKVSI